VRAKVLDAQWLGVPQARQRLIFIGMRDDLELAPVFPRPLPYRYAIRDALPNVQNYRYDTSGQFAVRDLDVTQDPAPTITANGRYHHQITDGALSPDARQIASVDGVSGFVKGKSYSEKRKFMIDELKAICAFPPDFVLTGSYAQQWERLGNSVPPLMMRAVAGAVRDTLLKAEGAGHG
jgi:DNA (cytosine-5)-methyltransferase 1